MRQRRCTVAACRDPVICHYRMRGGRYCCYGSRHAATVHSLRDPHKPKDERVAEVTVAMRSRCCTVAACRDPLICHYRTRCESYYCYEEQVLYGRCMPRPINLPLLNARRKLLLL